MAFMKLSGTMPATSDRFKKFNWGISFGTIFTKG